ncbi:tetratricopeptide repeat protein [Streptomyces sp. NPDC003691]
MRERAGVELVGREREIRLYEDRLDAASGAPGSTGGPGVLRGTDGPGTPGSPTTPGAPTAPNGPAGPSSPGGPGAPSAPHDPRGADGPRDTARRPLLHLHGVAGVGKSSLLRRFAAAAREREALTAVLDESVTGVPEALSGICEQFAAQGVPLKPLEKLLATYQQRRYEAESALPAPEAAAAAGPAGGTYGYGGGPGQPPPPPAGLLAAAQFGVVGLGTVLPVAGILDPVRLAEQADGLRSALSRRFGKPEDVQLVLNPAQVLSPVLVAELDRLAGRGRRIALFFDTYERTGPFLDPWLRQLLAEHRYGTPPAALTVTVSGQRRPDPAVWADHPDLLTELPLAPFTDAEARQLLTAKHITDEDVVRDVLRLSGRLPVLVSMLAENATRPDGMADPSATAVERFLKWETDPVRHTAALRGALPRSLNEDILLAAIENGADGPDGDTAAPVPDGLFDWLSRLPFVSDRSGRARYHDVVRDPMLRLQRHRSPRRWRAAHTRLADAFASWAAEESDGDTDETGLWAVDSWRSARTEETYHRLCARPRTALAAALGDGVAAADQSVAAARHWARSVADAGADTDDAALRRLGAQCLTAVEDDAALAVPLLGLILGRAETGDATRRDALLVRARLRRKLGAYDEALADCRLAIALGEDTVRAHHALGETYRQSRRYEEALAAYDRVLEREPDNIVTIASAAHAHHRLGRSEEALAGFDRVIDAHPRYLWALVMRSEVRRSDGDDEGALADVLAAADIEPDNAWVVGAHAEQLRHEERFEEAILRYDRAIALDPGYTWAFGSRAMALQSLGRTDEALADLGRALELDPDYSWALLRRAEIHRQRGDAAAELADLGLRVTLRPGLAAPLVCRAEALFHHNRDEEALADCDAAVACEPDHAGAHGVRGCVLAAMDRDAEAREALDRALELDRGLVGAVLARAGVRGRNGDPEGEYDDLCTALAIDPDHVDSLIARAEADCAAGRYDMALVDLDRAVLTFPDDPSAVLATRGRALRGLGRTAEALADLARAAELAPAAEWILLELAGLHLAEDRPFEALAVLVRPTGGDELDGAALLLRARAHLALGDTAAALADTGRAAALGEHTGALAVLADPALAGVPEAHALNRGLTGADGGSGT